MGDSATVPIRTAATVVLLRDSTGGPEVFLFGRVASMAFAGGMTAFPGGGVDPSDARPITREGPGDEWWADRFGADPVLVASVLVAAARELFEETGVLLAQVRPDDAGKLEAVAAHRLSFAELLAERALRADLLRPWARWVTPTGQSRRYDTFFLLAALPDGQQARLLTTEAHLGSWWLPTAALAAGRAGELALLPPTVAVLEDLLAFDDVAEVLAADRRVRSVSPRVVSSSGEPLRVLAGDRVVEAIGVPTP